MAADVHTLGRPYAKAVFALAREQQKLADWSLALAQLATAVTSPSLTALIGHPAVSRATLVQAFTSHVSGEMKNLIGLLVENGRLKLAPAIAAEFERLRAEAERRAEVAITTAVPVEAAQQRQLVDAVSRRLGQQVEVRWQTDATVLGGARIQAGDLVIDGTLAGEVERLRSVLTQS